MPNSLKTLVCAAFKKERPLDADDPTYVDLNRVRQSELVCRSIEQFITLAPDNPRPQLLTGQRGSGKTTELKRIASSLERAGYIVIHFETEPFVELEDVTVTDVLVAILRAVADGLKRRGIPPIDSPGDSIRALLSEWANLLTSRIELDKVDVDAGVIKLGFEATHTATVRERVRTLLSTRPQVLDDGIREYMDGARDRVKASGSNGLVVMVDNLDRISSHNVPNTGVSIYWLLLVEGAPRLAQLPCHLVYTVPSDLRFGLEGRNVEIAFGSEIQFLPLVPTHYPDGTLYTDGVNALEEIVKSRIASHGLAGVFGAGSVRQLALHSGGYVRGLLGLVESCIIAADKPLITARDVDAALQRQADRLERTFSPAQMRVLEAIHAGGKSDDNETSGQLQRVHALLEYQDPNRSGPYQRVSPAVAELITRRMRP